MTIGLYDIDFNHGINFSINLSLMKIYNKFLSEGHRVIMMQPYEKTGRYNKIFYFKENPSLKIPNSLIINSDKGVTLGYGFYKNNGLSKAMSYSPSFSPYDLNSNRIKNLKLYHSIKNNNLISWRDKDFTYTFDGKAFTYVNDYEFLIEQDWSQLFEVFDNNIEFLHSIKTHNFEIADKFLKLYKGHRRRLIIPLPEKNRLIHYCNENVLIDNSNLSSYQEFLIILFIKTNSDSIINFLVTKNNNNFRKAIYNWGMCPKRISFNKFTNRKFENKKDFLNFPNRILLKQNPQTMNKNTIDELLTINL